MHASEFLPDEELDNIPDDPNRAFIYIVNFAQGRLREIRRQLHISDASDNEYWCNLTFSFIATIVGTAREFGIEAIANYSLPHSSDYTLDFYRQFSHDLDACLIQAKLEARRSGFIIEEKSKDRIRAHVAKLREAIINSSLGEKKKKDLMKKLENFERDLQARRIAPVVFTVIALDILSGPGAVYASYDALQRLVANILETAAEAKAADEERQELLNPPPKLLLPNRMEAKPRKDPYALSDDDEIPF